MNREQGIFQRYEKKYLLTNDQYHSLKSHIQGKLAIDTFGKASICNIYFDTDSHLLIRNSIEKPIYKEKLRLRSYGIPEEGDNTFVELKKKYDGVVYKRRIKLELTEAERFLYDGKKPKVESQITKEIIEFLNLYKNQYKQRILPSMYIGYNRVAMYGIEDDSIRITFDSNIVWREEELYLQSGMWGNPLLKDGERLMEIKILGAMPLWLSGILDELNIYPSSFSKYGKAYEESITKQYDKFKGDIKYA